MIKENSVFFISGASSGFGLELSKKCIDEGYRVIATSRDPAKIPLENRENLLKFELDITKQSEIDKAIMFAIEKFGTIDILINNAGFCVLGYFEEISSALVEEQMLTNYFGTLNLTRSALPILRKNCNSWIVTISSVSGIKGNLGTSIYAASKFALEGWMEALQKEVDEWGIKCLLVEPGSFRTSTFDFARSCKFSDLKLQEYSKRRNELLAHYQYLHGKQDGDPRKLAKYVIEALKHEAPPFRLYLGKRAWKGVNEYYKGRYSEFINWKAWGMDSDYE